MKHYSLKHEDTIVRIGIGRGRRQNLPWAVYEDGQLVCAFKRETAASAYVQRMNQIHKRLAGCQD